jgi:type IV pilus assembly protein PilQ
MRLISTRLISACCLISCVAADATCLLGGLGRRSVMAQSQGVMSLAMRRTANGVEVVIAGVGEQPVLQQRIQAGQWQGRLQTRGTPGVRNGQQQISDPSLGLAQVSLSGAGSTYSVNVELVEGQPLSEPVVSADGQDLILQFSGLVLPPSLQTGRLDLNTPGRLPQPRYAPPLRPRAVAPPLGDMAVGTMVLQNRSYVNVSGPPVTLTLNNAPAKDALMALARLGGYGFVYVGDDAASPGVTTANASGASTAPGASGGGGRPVSIAFQNESYARALNGVLLASGLQGKLDGRTLLVGSAVSAKTFGPQVSKVYRLNQASAASAADYLASLGASISKVNTTSITSSETASSGTPANNTAASTATTSQLTNIETYGASVGPLRGLSGTSDSRLQTITLVGDSNLVAVAESYLKQIDLRQRQVALSVRILDVTLDNDAAINNSFAFRYGNNFIVSDRGELVGAFGNLLPPNNNNFDTISGEAQSGKPERVTASGDNAQVADTVLNPIAPARINPGTVYPKDNFFDFVRAMITSSSTKTLASPTLILSENPSEISGGAEVSVSGADSAFNAATIGRPRANESFITVGTQEIISYTVQAGQNGAPNSCQPEFGTAGLTFGARVSKIDDNGFVTFTLSPSIAAPTDQQQSVSGCGNVTILSVRRLDTGSLRVRDGQTLILTGVISDSDLQRVRKWPILGDIPLVGQFFRGSDSQRQKRELVILVTPRIIDDRDGGSYGYGYQPSLPAARQLLQGNL